MSALNEYQEARSAALKAPEREKPRNLVPVKTMVERSLTETKGIVDPNPATSHLEAAKGYLDQALNVHALLPGSESPANRLAESHNRMMTVAETRAWWMDGDDYGIGIVTGPISGLVVMNIEGPEGESSLSGHDLPPTPTVITPQGRHLYFRHPGGHVANRDGMLPGVDLIGDGGHVVAPPSVIPTGSVYRWADGLRLCDIPIADAPEWLLAAHAPAPVRMGVA